jgi:uncharacterized membrane-anchored protein YjiN (DUF445 family)
MDRGFILLGNKYKANVALLFSALLFALFMGLKVYYSGQLVVQLFYAVSEAALVGGVADWFAVTALFRRPLGFAYHTALIPRNRDKLVQATADMVQNELLSTESIQLKLAQIRFIDLFINWVEQKGGKAILADLVAHYASDIIAHIDTAKISQSAETIVKKAALDWNIVPELRSLGCYLLANNYEKDWINFLVGQLKLKVAQTETRQRILDYLREYAEHKLSPKHTTAFSWLTDLFYEGAKAVDAINFDDAAIALQQEILEIIQDLEDNSHPLRLWVKQSLQEVIERLGSDEAQSTSLECWKKEFIERIDFGEIFRGVFAVLLQSLPTANNHESLFLRQGKLLDHYKQLAKKSPLIGWVLLQIERYWELFLLDKTKLDWAEQYLQQAVCHIVDSQHEFIGSLVRDVLEQLSDDDFNAFIEDKAGEDLQWVRINGSVVGALVGLLLFLFLHYIYGPWLLPLIKPLLG